MTKFTMKRKISFYIFIIQKQCIKYFSKCLSKWLRSKILPLCSHSFVFFWTFISKKKKNVLIFFWTSKKEVKKPLTILYKFNTDSGVTYLWLKTKSFFICPEESITMSVNSYYLITFLFQCKFSDDTLLK